MRLLTLLFLQASSSPSNADAASIELLQSAVTAEVQKLAGKSDASKTDLDLERDMTDQMVRPVSALMAHNMFHCVFTGVV